MSHEGGTASSAAATFLERTSAGSASRTGRSAASGSAGMGAIAPGLFRPGAIAPIPALPLAALLPVLLALPALVRSKNVAAALDAVPPSWLIGLQVYRVLGAVFLVRWAAGQIPGEFALPAGTGDVLVGLLALPVAFYVHSRARGSRAAGYAWNLLGIL